jgi:uncharacterized protein YbbC (DUF1343 family)
MREVPAQPAKQDTPLVGCSRKRGTRRLKKDPQPEVLPGAEVFLRERLDLVKNKRVGLVTHTAAVNRARDSMLDLCVENPEIQVVALFGPEHGIRSGAQAGEYVPFARHEKYDLPVFSLYGQDLQLSPEASLDLDGSMRAFDIVSQGKIPAEEILQGIDSLIFDLQDVGTRVYTYAATMAYCLQACAACGIEMIVLDRPNPLNGISLEGPILDYPRFSSFVGLYPIPLRHGMTLGELALYIRDKFLVDKPVLEVIPVRGWKRDMWFDETSLPWIPPSPNMPRLETAMVYPGQVLWEGTNVSEGRGTCEPFEVFGAPWIDGKRLSTRLNDLGLPGVQFFAVGYTPTASKYHGDRCEGCRIVVMDRDIFQPVSTTLHAISTVIKLFPDRLSFHAEYFDRVVGTERIRAALELKREAWEIGDECDREIERFLKSREPYLLYN